MFAEDRWCLSTCADLVRQFDPENIRRNALENRHFAVVFANIVAGLAPPVGGPRPRRQRKQHQNDDDYGICAVALRLCAVVASYVPDVRAMALATSGSLGSETRAIGFCTIGISPVSAWTRVAISSRDRRRLRDRRLFRLLVVDALRAGRISAAARCAGDVSVAQGGRGSDRFVDDVRNGFETGARRAADKRGLMRQVERIASRASVASAITAVTLSVLPARNAIVTRCCAHSS